jgi:hypothetical protein
MNISGNLNNQQVQYPLVPYEAANTNRFGQTTDNVTLQGQAPKEEINTVQGRKWFSFMSGLFRHSNTTLDVHNEIEPKATDKDLSAKDSSSAVKVNKGEMAARYTNNILLHLVGSDGPALMSIAANAGNLPHFLAPLLGPFNAINSATGIASIVADMRETAGTFHNPSATKTDKIMDASHLILGDFVSTAASLLPMVTPLTDPIAMTFFVGGQMMGMGMDIAKTAYDISRNGQQSVYQPAKQD